MTLNLINAFFWGGVAEGPCKNTKKHHFQIAADSAMSTVYTHTLVLIATHAIRYLCIW